MLIIKKASSFTTEEQESLGIVGIPENWPVYVYPYVDTVPSGYEQIEQEDYDLLRENNQAAYDAWVQSKRPLPTPRNPQLVQPTVTFNEHLLVPKGMKKIRFQADAYCKPITLSARDGSNFTFASDLVPQVGSYITQNDCMLRFFVEAVDGATVTLGSPDGMSLDDLVLTDPILLSNPFVSDCLVEFEDKELLYLWGLTFQARNYGEDDVIFLKVMMDHPEAGMIMVKPYERTWVSNVNKVGIIHTPDEAPGEIPAGIIMRIEYFTFKSDATIIHANFDYIFTVKE